VIYEELNDTTNAKVYYHKVIETDPEHNKARVNLAVCLDREGKIEEASQHYKKALQINGADPKIHHNMGINLKRQGRLDEALKYYK
jgi:protein O-GlcNAc transferase